jgi:excisionase family DNA binding protein
MEGNLLTPRELADAIGASESSLRRWIDGGRVKMSRTAGGHRRIPVSEAIRFIRETGATVLRPDLLGLSEATLTATPLRVGNHAEQLYRALLDGDRLLARGVMMSWYLRGEPLAALFDGPLRTALHRIGELWSHDERGILIEHRATQICTEAITHLRAAMPPVPAGATVPVAVGGAPSGDLYSVPSLAAAATLAEAGFRDINYGPNTPLPLLGFAAREQAARLVWVSVSSPGHDERLAHDLASLGGRLAAANAHLVIGGRSAAAHPPAGLKNVHVMNSMAELSAFAKGLLVRGPRVPGRRAAPGVGKARRAKE